LSRARMIITVASGRRAKWAVVVFWLIIVAVAGPLSGKLTGAEKNDSSSWLPAKAESTKVLDLQSRIDLEERDHVAQRVKGSVRIETFTKKFRCTPVAGE